MDGPMLWGYFFTDGVPGRLERLSARLQADGYRFVELFDADVDADVAPYRFLHVERAETHSVSSLHERNAELYALAEEFDVDAYDGMDVGPLANS
jgi:hypothetical protein